VPGLFHNSSLHIKDEPPGRDEEKIYGGKSAVKDPIVDAEQSGPSKIARRQEAGRAPNLPLPTVHPVSM